CISMQIIIFFTKKFFQFALCRDVALPVGPLYRVAGFPVSLACVVSGFEGSRTQDFEWFLYRDDAGGRQMGVVSTRDPGFPYAPFQARVRNGEVRVERDAGDRVRLVIHRLRSEDQGKYECYTPSTDTTYQGNYSASVTVKVIPDTLQISYSRLLTGQPLPEGAELTLTCSGSIQSEQLTHLSVVFGKRGGEGDDAEIISIDKMRYKDGEITLEKRSVEGGQDEYVMKMRGVRADDGGSYFCEASQWIRDPDRSWQKIAQRKLDIGNLTVNKLGDIIKVMPSPQGEVNLQIGSPLLLTCEVQGLPSQINYGLLVQWTINDGTRSKEVLCGGDDPGGVVSWGDELNQGARGSLEKVSEGRYSLKLFSVQPADSGSYRCASLHRPLYSQQSEGVTVSLRTKDVHVTATVQLPRGPLLKRGNTITLLCNVSVITTGPAQAQVQWLRWPIPKPVMKKGQSPPSEQSLPDPPVEAAPEPIATLRHDGVARIFSNSSEVSVDRVSAGSYRLRVHVASSEDQGLYACHANAWGQDPHGAWYDTGVRAESNAVTVYLYSRAEDLLLIPLVVGVSSALFVGIVIISTVTCCFMRRLARQRPRK
uniref:Immunoglobulin superfamily, member 8 n=1 Tax=Neogobius melanostomus TaxID=47308 RepID=A0A8C6TCK8_9GOBI